MFKPLKNLKFRLHLASEHNKIDQILTATVSVECARKHDIENYSYFRLIDVQSGRTAYSRVQLDLRNESNTSEEELSLSSDLHNFFNETEYSEVKQIELQAFNINTDMGQARTCQILTSKQGLNTDKKKLIKELLYKPIFSPYSFVKQNIQFTISEICGHEVGLVPFLTENTLIKCITKEQSETQIKYNDIVGFDSVKLRLTEFFELPQHRDSIFKKLNVKPNRGLLITGPKGCGKTTLVKVIAEHVKLNVIDLNCAMLVTKFAGEAEENLRKIFNKCKEKTPMVLVLDNLEVIAKKSDHNSFDFERKLVHQLIQCIAEARASSKMFIVGIGDSSVVLDEGLKINGVLEQHVFVKPPNQAERQQILDNLLSKKAYDGTVNTFQLSELTVGYVVADLIKLTEEAGRLAVIRIINEECEIPHNKIGQVQLLKAAEVVSPSCLKQFSFDKTGVKWRDVIGLSDTIIEIKNKLILPRKYSSEYKEAGFEGVKGLILYGPPGTGKTLIAKAIATEFNYNFISIKGPELKSKFIGETEQALRRIFQLAQLTAPTIIFFDEIDSIFGKRSSERSGSDHDSSVIGQLLTELDGMKKLSQVLVIGTTNRLDCIDKALLRPGRLEIKLKIDYPDAKAIYDLFKYYTRNLALRDGVTIQYLISKFMVHNITGAQVSSIVRELFEESLLAGTPMQITREICETLTNSSRKQISSANPLYN